MKEFIEKLIERLEEEKQRLRNLKNNCIALSDSEVIAIEEGAYNFCKKIVNQLAEEYINTSTDTSSGWIACSERLPKPIDDMLQCVIVTNKNDWQGMAYYHPQKGWIFAECNNSDRKIDWTEIVAWRPLPAPYKEGE